MKFLIQHWRQCIVRDDDYEKYSFIAENLSNGGIELLESEVVTVAMNGRHNV